MEAETIAEFSGRSSYSNVGTPPSGAEHECLAGLRPSADSERCLEHGQRYVSWKADVAVRIELGDIDVSVGQRLEPDRTEERLLRLDQENRLREA